MVEAVHKEIKQNLAKLVDICTIYYLASQKTSRFHQISYLFVNQHIFLSGDLTPSAKVVKQIPHILQ